MSEPGAPQTVPEVLSHFREKYAPSVRIPQPTRDLIAALHARTDAEVARAITADRLHRGTALAVLKQFAIEVEKMDQEFGAELVATHTEAVVRGANHGG